MSEPLQPGQADYLRDESRHTGHADHIVFPRHEQDVLAALAEARANRWPITVQGARTGVAGGAVPAGGLILNLSRMKAIRVDGDTLRVEPGATLNAIRAATPPGYFFAPDPTETTASIGGMIACNSSGALSFRYGPTRNHVGGLRVALANGEVLDLRRGRDQARDRHAVLGPWHGELPALPQPAVKNAAGYFVAPAMDLCDLFIGAEGTLGIVTAATLRLLPTPAATVGLMMFLPTTAAAVDLVQALRADRAHSPAPLAALEYFDSRCLDFLQARAAVLASKGIVAPARPPGTAGIYAEWHAPTAEAAEAAMLAAAERLPALGADPDACLLADHPHELEKLKLFRHAVPELVNAEIDERRRQHPGIIKLGTDMSVPDARLADVAQMYTRDLAAAGLDSLIFGHIGANHLHVNILPRNADDYAAGRALYAQWATQIIAWGGSISAEHGIGKLKRDLFRQMVGEEALARMRAFKQQLDPDWLLNPGTLLPAP